MPDNQNINEHKNQAISSTGLDLNFTRADFLNSIIKDRKSTFPYQYEKGRKVPDKIIWQILENANRAPNHKQTEPWRFSVFTGEALQQLGELQQKLYKENSGAAFTEAKYQKLLDYPLMSSHVISIGMKRSEKQLPETEEIAAVACAVENMYLSATAYGLGCYWTTGGITYIESAKPYFGLEPADKLLGFFYIGYIAKPSEVPSKRNPIQEKVTWVDGLENKLNTDNLSPDIIN